MQHSVLEGESRGGLAEGESRGGLARITRCYFYLFGLNTDFNFNSVSLTSI